MRGEKKNIKVPTIRCQPKKDAWKTLADTLKREINAHLCIYLSIYL